MLRSKWSKALVWLLCLLPALWFTYGAFTNNLGPNPIEAITRGTGDWTLRLLLVSLAITPARRLLGAPDLIRFRRMLGLWAFFYAFLHLMTWVWLDKFFDPAEMWADVAKRKFVTAGMAGFLCLLPLAITSTTGWIRRLGKNWQRLHRLAYLAAAAGVVHYWWLVKSDIRLPAMYGLILLALLSLRLVNKRPQPASR
ncbi:MAG: sulfoxide reductase heme-binding subunit YedZ [Acidobacteria bacterium]|nr:sulfoxide reductase heme-binding subunit YedZ [Acidobacteriota bacterium]